MATLPCQQAGSSELLPTLSEGSERQGVGVLGVEALPGGEFSSTGSIHHAASSQQTCSCGTPASRRARSFCPAGSTSSSSPESTAATMSQIPLELVVAGNLGDSGGVRAMFDFCKGLSLLNLSPECLPSRWTGWFSSLARGVPTQTKCSSLLSFFPPSFSSLFFFSFPNQRSLRSP